MRWAVGGFRGAGSCKGFEVQVTVLCYFGIITRVGGLMN